MTEANNVHPSEVGLAVAAATPILSKKEQAKLANIIGFFRDAADAAFPVQGLEVMTDPSRDVLTERMEALKGGALVAQRARLEADPYFRHPIPYILIFRQRDDGGLEFFIYQRTKLIGEDLLAGNHSVGLGGHPEAPCIRFHPDWSFNLTESLMACVVEELDEEVTFNGLSFSDYSETGGLFTYGHEGFLRDDSNKVGLQHIGIVYTIGLPANVEVECIEDELVTVGFRTLEELGGDLELPAENSLYDFENWSRICLLSTIERIEATKAAEAVDALFVQEEGFTEAEFEVVLEPGEELKAPRGETAFVAHVDELPFLPPAGDEPATMGTSDIGRGLTNPVLHFTVPEDVTGMTRGEDGVLYFELDPADPDPQTTLNELEAIYHEVIRPAPVAVYEDTAAVADTNIGSFAQTILQQATEDDTAGEVVYMAVPVNPAPETAVLTELHREVGITDDQMKRGVDELTRISDSVQ